MSRFLAARNNWVINVAAYNLLVNLSGLVGYTGGYVLGNFSLASGFTVYVDYDYSGSLQAGANAVQNGNANTYFEFLQPSTNQIANTALEATINIPPTLRKNQGDNVSIFVARDLNFYQVYKLELAAPPVQAGSRL